MEKILSTKVPDALLTEIDAAIAKDKYLTYSEFLRAAIREKLESRKRYEGENNSK